MANMIVFADDKASAEKALSVHQEWTSEDYSSVDRSLVPLMNRLFGDNPVYRNASQLAGRWKYAFFVKSASVSHFDLLVDSSQENTVLPDGILCIAGSGSRFHGQRGRPWTAEEGNLHLSISLSPDKKIAHYHAGLPVLSAVSIVQAIDTVEGLEGSAKIKWVNDVQIQEAKVGGFLVHIHSVRDRVMNIVLGIGLNVEKTPNITPDVFTPKVGSIKEFCPSSSTASKKSILKLLLELLDKNYKLLLYGKYKHLLDFYRKNSLVIGREVQVFPNVLDAKQTPISSGTVEKIGDNLELWMEGQKKPVTEGRLVF
jgi:biotin-[acetyl-CoA-carboxylase] ligase BirA-like protein